jgi:hypothetical protein
MDDLMSSVADPDPDPVGSGYGSGGLGPDLDPGLNKTFLVFVKAINTSSISVG